VPHPRYVENLPSRWRFVADRCAACHRVSFPARGICAHCGATAGLASEPLPLDGGTVEAATVVAPGAQPTEFDPLVEAFGSYAVVLVRLSAEVRVTLQVADCDPGSLKIGDRVATRLRRLYPMEGAWRYGRKAVPIPGGAA
jgi:hydroxymethylglutaryl-CoA synthase